MTSTVNYQYDFTVLFSTHCTYSGISNLRPPKVKAKVVLPNSKVHGLKSEKKKK